MVEQPNVQLEEKRMAEITSLNEKSFIQPLLKTDFKGIIIGDLGIISIRVLLLLYYY